MPRVSPSHGLAATLLAATLLAGSASAATLRFQATMNAASEVPPNTSSGTGEVTATLDTTNKTLDYTVTYQNLTGPAVAAHFHGPAAVGQNAAVAVPITGNLTSPIHETAKLTDAQIADFEAGKMYANVHTKDHPGGEIRGQMVKMQ